MANNLNFKTAFKNGKHSSDDAPKIRAETKFPDFFVRRCRVLNEWPCSTDDPIITYEKKKAEMICEWFRVQKNAAKQSDAVPDWNTTFKELNAIKRSFQEEETFRRKTEIDSVFETMSYDKNKVMRKALQADEVDFDGAGVNCKDSQSPGFPQPQGWSAPGNYASGYGGQGYGYNQGYGGGYGDYGYGGGYGSNYGGSGGSYDYSGWNYGQGGNYGGTGGYGQQPTNYGKTPRRGAATGASTNAYHPYSR